MKQNRLDPKVDMRNELGMGRSYVYHCCRTLFFTTCGVCQTLFATGLNDGARTRHLARFLADKLLKAVALEGAKLLLRLQNRRQSANHRKLEFAITSCLSRSYIPLARTSHA
jgi:hypothetical protein